MSYFRKIIIPPATSYETYFEKYKFHLVWKIYLLLAFFSFGLVASNIIINSLVLKTNLVSFISILMILISLKVTKKYNIAVLIVFIMGTGINQYTLFTAVNVERIIDLMWIIAVSIFIFYMIGYKFGLITVIINFTGIIIALFYVPKSTIIATIENQTLGHQIENAFSIIAATAVIAYFIKKIIAYSQHNEKKLFEANKDLLKERDEKIVMLQEIHHRVKNNLQIISSLLRLQANETDNTAIKEEFQEAINRVSSMALIHEKIYHTDDLSSVDIKNYLESLVDDILKSYVIDTKILFSMESNVKNFHIDTLVPLSLIFNELITNSIKHGFINQKEREITIKIEKKKEVKINYSDNGIGFSRKCKESFGSLLIDTFTEQLEGSFIIDHSNGVNYEFTFEKLN
jgi:two-component sensor histidine kinase